MDARTGELLAVSNPTLSVAAHPIGSLFKLVTAVAALESGAVRADHVERCIGKTPADGRIEPCWLRAGHGEIDLREAIAVSCNVYFYQLGRRVSPGRIVSTARKFGLGAPVAHGLWNESAGSLPDFIRPRTAQHIAAGDSPDIKATPLQIAVLAAGIATGRRVFPRVGGGNAAASHRLPFVESLAVVREGMAAAVDHGTCERLSNLGYSIAGKTGTAPAKAGGYNAWFAGFTPVDKPEIVIVVFLENGRGGPDAVPVARRAILAYYESKDKK